MSLPFGVFFSHCVFGICCVFPFSQSDVVSLCRSLPYGDVDMLVMRGDVAW